MEPDSNRIGDAVLALLLLGLHDGRRAWNGFGWDAMDRLAEKDYISDARSKAKSVVFSDAGLARSRAMFVQLFGGEP